MITIISLSSAWLFSPLWVLVACETFNTTLYYRLNLVSNLSVLHGAIAEHSHKLFLANDIFL